MEERNLDNLWADYLASQDKATFDEIYRQTNRLVFTLCYRILQDEELATEAFQMGFVRLLSEVRAGKHQPGGEFKQTLYRTILREAWRFRSQNKRRNLKEFLVEKLPTRPAEGANIEQKIHNDQMKAQLEEFVEEMPEKYRVPIQLRYFHGLSQHEIALMLDKPDSTIMRRLNAGLKKLRERLDKKGFTPHDTLYGLFPAVPVLLSPPSFITADSIFAAAQQMPAGWTEPGLLDKIAQTFSAASVPKIAAPLILAAAALLPLSTLVFDDREETASESSMVVTTEDSSSTDELLATDESIDEATATQDVSASSDPNTGTVAPQDLKLNVYFGDTATPATGAELSAELFDDDGNVVEQTEWTATEGTVAATVAGEAEKMIVRASYPKTISQAFELPLEGDQSTHDIVLKPKGSLFGKVLYAKTGEPVQGAKVSLNHLSDASGNITMTTDPDGTYIAEPLPAGQVLIYAYKKQADMVWTHDFHEHAEAFTVTPDSAYGPYNVYVHAAHSINGQVRDAITGEGIPNVRIASYVYQNNVTARTDEEGYYHLDGVPIYPHAIVASADEGYIRQYRHVFLGTSSKTENDFDFELIPTTSLQLRVVDSNSQPINGVRITHYISILPALTEIAETNHHGIATIEEFNESFPGVIEIEKDGYISRRIEQIEYAQTENFITTDVVLTAIPVPSLKTVSGQVYVAEDAEYTKARIICQRDENSQVVAETEVDESGRYILEFEQGHEGLTLYAVRQGCGTEWWGIPKDSNHFNHDFELTRGGVVRGSVIDMNGNPVPDVHVHLLNFNNESERHLPYGQGFQITDPVGHFEFRDLSSQDYFIKITGTRMHSKLQKVTIGDTPQIVLGERGIIKGRLVSDEGEPISEFKIRSYKDSAEPDFAREIHGNDFNYSNGLFELPYLLRNEQYTLVALSQGYAPTRVENQQPLPHGSAEELTIQLNKGRVITGRIIDAVTKEPVLHAYVFHLPTEESPALDDCKNIVRLHKQYPDLQSVILDYDSNGIFEFHVNTLGYLFAKAPGYEPLIIEVKTDTLSQPIQLVRSTEN